MEGDTIILEGCPDDTVSGLMDLTLPPSGGCNWDTFSCTWDRMGVHKVHFGNQASDQTATTEPTGDTSQLDLIEVQVAARKKDQTISQGKHSHFSLASVSHPGSTTAHPGNVCHLMSDYNTAYGSSLTSGQKCTAKAANLDPDKVKYDVISYKICMAELSYGILHIGILF
jgi:hypothetical protein